MDLGQSRWDSGVLVSVYTDVHLGGCHETTYGLHVFQFEIAGAWAGNCFEGLREGKGGLAFRSLFSELCL